MVVFIKKNDVPKKELTVFYRYTKLISELESMFTLTKISRPRKRSTGNIEARCSRA